MEKKLQQIVSTCEGWEAAFLSYDDGKLFREPIVCWAFMSERPYVEDGEDEERYIEGQVAFNGGNKIIGVYDVPENIAFLGYLNTKLPEEKIEERVDHFKDQAKQLMEIRRSGHLPVDRN
jgi:hypothetical protein